jgi:L-fucose isomerase-like protein
MPTAIEHGAMKNLGVMIFGRKRPGFDQDWSKIISERCLKTLTGLGFNCIGAETRVTDDETIHATMDKIEQQKCEALVIIQPSMSDGQFALTIGQRWSGPVILWTTPERPGDGKVSSCSLVGQHLWSSIYRQAHHPFELVYGGPDDDLSKVEADLLRAVALASAVYKLRRAKVGVVGTHVPGFIDLAADPFLISQTLGLQFHPLSLVQFIERVNNVDEAAVSNDILEVRKLGLKFAEKRTDAELAVNSRYYLAINDLMREMRLDALALQCWPELAAVLGQWPYLAINRLTTAGKAISIEGDADGAIGSLISCLLGIGPGALTDWLEHDNSSIFFWHPGMAPLDMCNPVGGADAPLLAEHFNVVKPFVVEGPLKIGQPVTVSRLWRCDNKYHMTAFEGRSIKPRRQVTGNSLLMEVSGEPVPARFDRMIHAGMPHHVTLHFGNYAETFRRLARLLGIEWHG